MKTLSVRQPYANAIFASGKTIENRAWRTDYRGKLWIHASQRPDLGEEVDAARADVRRPIFIGDELGAVIGSLALPAVNGGDSWAHSASTRSYR